MIKVFASTLGLFAIIIGIVIYRTGIYKEVTILPSEQGPLILVYNDHLGPYHKIVPVIENVENFFAEKNLACPLTFGRYLDDPNNMDQDRLRSHGGCVFNTMTEALNQAINEGQYKTETLPRKEYVMARFNGSPSVSPYVVYPKIDKWFAKYGYKRFGPVIEMYKILENETVLTSYLFQYSIAE